MAAAMKVMWPVVAVQCRRKDSETQSWHKPQRCRWLDLLHGHPTIEEFGYTMSNHLKTYSMPGNRTTRRRSSTPVSGFKSIPVRTGSMGSGKVKMAGQILYRTVLYGSVDVSNVFKCIYPSSVHTGVARIQNCIIMVCQQFTIAILLYFDFVIFSQFW